MAKIIPYPRKPISHDRMFRIEFDDHPNINAFLTLSSGVNEPRFVELITALIREREKLINDIDADEINARR